MINLTSLNLILPSRFHHMHIDLNLERLTETYQGYEKQHALFCLTKKRQ